MVTTTKKAKQIDRRVIDQARGMLANCLVREQRPFRVFAEQEIIVPRGKFAGKKFRTRRMPASGLWFDELDSRP